MSDRRVYGAMAELMCIGSYGAGGAGVTTAWRDPATGLLSGPASVLTADCASVLAPHPDGRTLFAGHEITDGKITTLRAGQAGALTVARQAETGEPGPCHLLVHPSGRHLLAAGYVSGTVRVIPLAPGGLPAGAGHAFTFDQAGPATSHPHACAVLSDGRIAITYLGRDLIVTARLDGHAIAAGSVAASPVQPGSGPRSLVAGPDGTAYTSDELASSVTRLSYRPATGTFTVAASAASYLGKPAGANYPSDIAFAAAPGRLYVANRGRDTITVLDTADGGLTPVAEVDAGGHWPQQLAVASGHLYVACQKSGAVTVFEVDPRTAIPRRLIQRFPVGSPSCLAVLPDPDDRLRLQVSDQ